MKKKIREPEIAIRINITGEVEEEFRRVVADFNGDYQHVPKYTLSEMVKNAMDKHELLNKSFKEGYSILRASYDEDDLDRGCYEIFITLIHKDAQRLVLQKEIDALNTRAASIGMEVIIREPK